MSRPFHRCFFSVLLSIIGLLFFITGPSSRAEDDVSDADILCAWQERFYAAKGWYWDWRKATQEFATITYPSYPNPTWPSSGTFTSAQIDSIYLNIWNALIRTRTSTSFPPLYYLEDDMVEGGRSWGYIQRKFVRAITGSPPSTTTEERRALILACIRRMNTVVVPITVTGTERRRRTGLIGSSGGPTNLAQAATLYDSTAWTPVADSNTTKVDFFGVTGNYVGIFGDFGTSFDVSRGTLTLPAYVTTMGWPATFVLHTDTDSVYGFSDAEYTGALAKLEA
ncbi:MAG TPA: hypothetical protein VHM91_18250, partial [Verrucomicrobiales bacterium]|nr:hypothetical protein [Verrucomicrobiales bacterium]